MQKSSSLPCGSQGRDSCHPRVILEKCYRGQRFGECCDDCLHEQLFLCRKTKEGGPGEAGKTTGASQDGEGPRVEAEAGQGPEIPQGL